MYNGSLSGSLLLNLHADTDLDILQKKNEKNWLHLFGTKTIVSIYHLLLANQMLSEDHFKTICKDDNSYI